MGKEKEQRQLWVAPPGVFEYLHEVGFYQLAQWGIVLTGNQYCTNDTSSRIARATEKPYLKDRSCLYWYVYMNPGAWRAQRYQTVVNTLYSARLVDAPNHWALSNPLTVF